MAAPFVVSSNDRAFACNENCNVSNNANKTAIGNFDFDGRFLDVEEIRNNLTHIMSAVSEAVSGIFTWVDQMEHVFALKYAANEITYDLSLFSQINAVINKIKRFRSMLDSWLSNFHKSVTSASRLLNAYGVAVAKLQPESTLSSFSLSQNVVSLAKANVTKSRTFNKNIKQILKLDNNIKTELMEIKSQVDLFYTGIIQVDNNMLNFKEFEQAIGSLSDDNSPLKQIQLALAKKINSQRGGVTLSSVQPAPIDVPKENQLANMKALSSTADVEKLVERLESIRDGMLYSDNTKPQLDRVIESAVNLSKYSDWSSVIQHICDEIKSRTPAKVIEYYRLNIRNPDGQFTRLANLKRIIENLDSDDSAYAPIFKNIYKEMNDDIVGSIRSDANYDVMDTT